MGFLHPSRPAPTGARAALSLAALTLAGAAGAQDAARLTPLFTAEGGLLETRGRIDGANGAEAVLRLSPGIAYTSRSGRLQGTVSYGLNLVEHRGVGATSGADVQHSAGVALAAELVPNWAYVDLNGQLGMQSTSPYAQQTAEGSLQRNESRVPVATGSIHPYVRGRLGEAAQYEAGFSVGQTRSKAVPGVDSKGQSALVVLKSPDSGAVLGWGLRLGGDRTQYAGKEPVDTRQASASVIVRPDPELQLTLRGGRETASQGDVAQSQSTSAYGAGLVWVPTPRTTVAADADRRYFGHSGAARVSHRMQRTVFSYSYIRDVTRSADALAFTKPTTAYDLLYSQLASTEPDPVARDLLVRDTLRNEGRDPAETVQLGFITSTLSLRQTQSVAVSWQGQRLSLSVQASADRTSPLILSSIADPVAGEALRQHGYAGSISYQLTPLTSASLSGERRMAFGISTAAGTDLKSAGLALTTQLGRTVTAQMGARYTVFNSALTPYRETAVSGTLNLRY